MTIQINEQLRDYIDPLTVNEYAALERSILAEGCRDALVLWGDVLIDGHNRYAICNKHGIEFKTVQNTSFSSLDDVMLWMIDNHLARRSVSDFQRGVLALRKKEIVAARARDKVEQVSASTPSEAPVQTPMSTRDEVAKVAGISSSAIVQIEKIQRAATPELVEAVRAGTISINAAAAVASLPEAAQVAAVAGGKKELQQAAKSVREAKTGTRAARTESQDAAISTQPNVGADVDALTKRIEELNAENMALTAQVAALSAALEDARRAA